VVVDQAEGEHVNDDAHVLRFALSMRLHDSVADLAALSSPSWAGTSALAVAIDGAGELLEELEAQRPSCNLLSPASLVGDAARDGGRQYRSA